MFCREQVARFDGQLDAIRAQGAEVHAIGNGTAAMAEDFVAQFGVRFPVYTDPSREAFRRAGLVRRFGIGVKSLGLARRALSAGHRQGRTQGDPWQQGGVLVVAPSGEVLWRHADSGVGDHGDPADALRALA
jgi:hypothetical protein